MDLRITTGKTGKKKINIFATDGVGKCLRMPPMHKETALHTPKH
jgi:hypothetical protein